MKIAIIVPGFSADEQDWCIPALRDFVRELATRDDVHVFALRYPAPARTYGAFGATVHAIGTEQRRGLARFTLIRNAWRAMVEEDRHGAFAAVHAIWADEPGWLATRFGRRFGIQSIVSVAGGELAGLSDIGYGVQLSWFGRRAVARALGDATWCTTGSALMAQRIAECAPHRPADSVRVVPLGTEVTRFTPLGGARPSPSDPDSAAPAILHVGSFTAIKNQRLAIDAFRQVASLDSAACLRLIGDGPLRSSLEQYVRDLGLADRVTFLGHRPHDELPGWYRGAAVCIMTSRHESQSLVALEALASGCPVVGLPVGVLPELSPACRTVPSADTSALATALVEVLQDDNARRRMASAGPRIVEERYSVARSVAAFRALYVSGKKVPDDVPRPLKKGYDPFLTRARRTDIEDAALRAIVYGDLFDYPLTLDEVARYIETPASRDEVDACLTSPRGAARDVVAIDEYFCLAGHEHLAEIRRRRAAHSARIWRRARWVARVLACMPFIRMIAVTGALAVDNCHAKDDIDLLIVTAPEAVWFCRRLIVLLSRLLPGSTLCPNFILSERALALSHRNLYVAHELAQMVPLYGQDVYRRFLDANAWRLEYLPNARNAPSHAKSIRAGLLGRSVKRVLEGVTKRSGASRLDAWELRRMIRHARRAGHLDNPTVVLDENQCKAHFIDYPGLLLKRYAEALERTGVEAHFKAAEKIL